MHLGHARTFWTAQQRSKAHGGTLVLRNEDLDHARCRPAFVTAMIEDLKWFGIEWQEGPDCGGPFGPYNQSQRHDLYQAAFESLRDAGLVYPCTCSRQDVLRALQAPHAGEDEPVYPGTCRPTQDGARSKRSADHQIDILSSRAPVHWRFRVPDGEAICFIDAVCGAQQFTAGHDFGDFIVWRQDNSPSYQLAVVVDDLAMHITEVVRGMDLLRSTARQLLLYRALGQAPPLFCHCPLLTDAAGVRLAKRHDALSLRQLRAGGATPESLRVAW
jgi:glutamyl-tRNA synthetase